MSMISSLAVMLSSARVVEPPARQTRKPLEYAQRVQGREVVLSDALLVKEAPVDGEGRVRVDQDLAQVILRVLTDLSQRFYGQWRRSVNALIALLAGC